MKLESSNFESEVFGAEKEMEFTIDTSSSVIFDILRDKMYTNKIAAVCREVSSNSRDANTEADRSEMPIKISIVEPYELDCISDKSIVFEDCGVGISPDRMADIFIKYAASTKRSNNEQVGGFGLGAKTPFAYSDTFTVITVCEHENKRMKYIYTAMIDDTQKGKMVLFESEETTESTGTKIVVPFNDSDRLDFEKEIHRATCLWDVRPELSGFIYSYTNQVFSKIVEDGDLIILEDSEQFFNTRFLVVLEGIPYKLDTGLFSEEFGDFVRRGIDEKFPIALSFKTGELSVSANREGIHYTEETKERISEKLRSIRSILEEKIVDYIKVDDNYLESCIRVNEMSR